MSVEITYTQRDHVFTEKDPRQVTIGDRLYVTEPLGQELRLLGKPAKPLVATLERIRFVEGAPMLYLAGRLDMQMTNYVEGRAIIADDRKTMHDAALFTARATGVQWIQDADGRWAPVARYVDEFEVWLTPEGASVRIM